MDFNLGAYLKIMFPIRVIGKGMGDFLIEFFAPIINDFDLSNKDGDDYDISKELVSRLANNLVNVPVVLQDAFKKSVNQEEKYLGEFKNTLKKFFSDENFLFANSEKVAIEFSKLRMPEAELNTILGYLADSKYDLFHWNVLKHLVLLPNKKPSMQTRKVGRPRKNDVKKIFFFLSEEEKFIEYKNLVKKYSKENAIISKNEFIYFLDAINYIDYHVDKRIKIKILKNFYKNLPSEKNFSKATDLITYFDHDAIAQGNINKYKEWSDLIPNAVVEEELDKLQANLLLGNDTQNFELLAKQFGKDLQDEVFYSNKNFKSKLVKNKFFLPEFTESICQSLWSVCHCIAEYAAIIGLHREFLSLMDSIEKSKPENKTYHDRCNGLSDRCKRTLRGLMFMIK